MAERVVPREGPACLPCGPRDGEDSMGWCGYKRGTQEKMQSWGTEHVASTEPLPSSASHCLALLLQTSVFPHNNPTGDVLSPCYKRGTQGQGTSPCHLAREAHSGSDAPVGTVDEYLMHIHSSCLQPPSPVRQT